MFRLRPRHLLLALLPLLGSLLARQIYIGLLLTLHYSPSSQGAFDSVQHVMQDSNSSPLFGMDWLDLTFTVIFFGLYLFSVLYAVWLINRHPALSPNTKTIWYVLTAVCPYLCLPLFCILYLIFRPTLTPTPEDVTHA